jgi:hypothetical protein
MNIVDAINYAFVSPLLPLGKHQIMLASIDLETNMVISNENGLLAKVWNHTIRFHQKEEGKLNYTDEIEIQAGFLTIIIWLFVHVFLPPSPAALENIIEL